MQHIRPFIRFLWRHATSLSLFGLLLWLTGLCAVSLDAVDLDGAYAVLAELDRIVGEAGGAGGAGGGKKSKKEKASTLYTGMAFKSGSLFPTAATTSAAKPSFGAMPRLDEEKQSAGSVDARRMAVLAGVTRELQPASALFRRAALSTVAGGGEAAQGTQARTREKEGSGVEGVEMKAAGLIEHEVEEKDQKVEAAAKYLFVFSWLQRRMRAAEHVSHSHTTLASHRITQSAQQRLSH